MNHVDWIILGCISGDNHLIPSFSDELESNASITEWHCFCYISLSISNKDYTICAFVLRKKIGLNRNEKVMPQKKNRNWCWPVKAWLVYLFWNFRNLLKKKQNTSELRTHFLSCKLQMKVTLILLNFSNFDEKFSVFRVIFYYRI